MLSSIFFDKAKMFFLQFHSISYFIFYQYLLFLLLYSTNIIET